MAVAWISRPSIKAQEGGRLLGPVARHRRAPVQLRHNISDRSRPPDGDLSPCPRRVLVAVPLVAHTLALERLILGRRNFQFLVSKVAPDPVPKHLDILL